MSNYPNNCHPHEGGDPGSDSRLRGNDKRVAIIYLSYHCELYLERAMEAWKKINYPREQWAIVVVDNPHPNYGNSRNFIQSVIQNNTDLPRIIFLPQEKNLGFTGGNNVGIKWALDNGFDYVFLHNQDGFMAPDCLAKAAETMETDKNIGAAQSLIMMYPETDLINTSGNKFHYLGFGFCGDYRRRPCHCEPRRGEAIPLHQEIASSADIHWLPRNDNKEIGYASGAAMMLRADLLKQFGGLDEDYFAYHEDLEYSLRLRSVGYKIALAPAAVFYHEHEYSRNPEKYYFMERNRCGLMFTYFKWPTLAIFTLAQAGVYLAELVSALRNGWIKSWFKVLGYWVRPKHWRIWLTKRARIQKMRKVTDRELLRLAVGKIEFDGPDTSGLLTRIGNFFINGYWRLIRRLIMW